MIEASPECVKVVMPDGIGPADECRRVAHGGSAFSDNDVIGTSVFDLIAPEEREAYAQFHARVCRGESASFKLSVIVAKSGTRRSGGERVGSAASAGWRYSQFAVTRDITARVHADAALELQKARLSTPCASPASASVLAISPLSVTVWDQRLREHFFIEHDRPITMEDFSSRLHGDQPGDSGRPRTRFAAASRST